MGIIDAIQSPVQTALSLIITPGFRERIVYKRFSAQESFDTSAGYPDTAYEEFRVYTVRLKHNKESVAMTNVDVSIGDMLFIFDFRDFPENPSLKDLIEDSEGNLFKVLSIDPLYELVVFVSVEGG